MINAVGSFSSAPDAVVKQRPVGGRTVQTVLGETPHAEITSPSVTFQGTDPYPHQLNGGDVRPPQTWRQKLTKLMAVSLIGITGGVGIGSFFRPEAKPPEAQVTVTQPAEPVAPTATQVAVSEPTPPHLIPIDPYSPEGYHHWTGLQGRLRMGGPVCYFNDGYFGQPYGGYWNIDPMMRNNIYP